MSTTESGATAAAQTSTGKRWWGRAIGLVLGMALPIWIIKLILSIPPISTALNRRVWCSDATSASREQIFGEREGGRVRSSTVLVCSKDGTTVRTVGGWKLELTQWTVAALIVFALLALAIGGLVVYGRLRRRRAVS